MRFVPQMAIVAAVPLAGLLLLPPPVAAYDRDREYPAYDRDFYSDGGYGDRDFYRYPPSRREQRRFHRDRYREHRDFHRAQLREHRDFHRHRRSRSRDAYCDDDRSYDRGASYSRSRSRGGFYAVSPWEPRFGYR